MVEIKMASNDQTKPETTNLSSQTAVANSCPHMESVTRVTKLPVVEATINAASSLYEKAKESNTTINYMLTTAETTVKTSVEKITPLAQPVTSRLEGPIKKVDELLCNGLDFVETKVPCVKLPPGEMYSNTKGYIAEKVQPAVESAKYLTEKVQPAVESAKHVVEPAVQTATAVKDYGLQKIEELKGKRTESTTDGRPRRVRPALLPSSMVSLVSMYVSFEELMQHQEHPHEDHDQVTAEECHKK